MLAVFVNTAAIILGGLLGLLFGGRLKEEHTKTIIAGLGLCTVVIGITGAIKPASRVCCVHPSNVAFWRCASIAFGEEGSAIHIAGPDLCICHIQQGVHESGK